MRNRGLVILVVMFASILITVVAVELIAILSVANQEEATTYTVEQWEEMVEDIAKSRETAVVIEEIETSCIEDITTRETEVQKRIELAVNLALLEAELENKAKTEFAKGSVVIFEDGSGHLEGDPSSAFCIPYAACDEIRGEYWVPQSVLIESWSWKVEYNN
jgi:hypothetical protein